MIPGGSTQVVDCYFSREFRSHFVGGNAFSRCTSHALNTRKQLGPLHEGVENLKPIGGLQEHYVKTSRLLGKTMRQIQSG